MGSKEEVAFMNNIIVAKEWGHSGETAQERK